MARQVASIISRFALLAGIVATNLWLLPDWARAQGAELEFQLDLDTGGHRALIRALSISADGAVLASAGDDKTVRLWDVAARETVTILRGQIGPGSEGVINAVALSPDADHVAVGGFFAPHTSVDLPYGDLRIFNTQTGRILRVLRGLRYPVEALAYSAGRDELAAGGQDGIVMRWQAPFATTEPVALPPLDTEANRVRFLSYALGDRRLVVATEDYGLRLWDLDSGALVAPELFEELEDIAITGLAVSLDGRRFALAGIDGRIEIRDAETGALFGPGIQPRPFRPGALAFADDAGALLVVSCGYECGTQHRAEVWNVENGEILNRHLDHDAGISAAISAPLAETGAPMILTAGSRAPEILLWDAQSARTLARLGGIGRPVSAVGLSTDAARIGWGHEDPCPELPNCPATLGAIEVLHELPVSDRGFDGAEPRVARPSDSAGLVRALLSDATTRLEAQDRPDARFQGARLRIDHAGQQATIDRGASDGYFHSALTLMPETGRVVSGGGNGYLLAHDLAGRFAAEFTGHTGSVLAVAASETASRLVSGSADQTVRIWNLETGRTIVTGFASGEHWIWWTPEGYYHSSPEADAIVGWHINQGQDREARFIRARQLRRHLHNPAVVRQALLTGESAAAAESLMGASRGLETLLIQQPPSFDLRVADEIAAPAGQLAIELTGASAEEIADWGLSILVNSRRVRPEPYVRSDLVGRSVYLIAVDGGENDIRVASRDGFDNITERGATAIVPRVSGPVRGKLHVAVIGIDSYPELPPTACAGRPCDLRYAVADAVGFLEVVTSRMAPLHDGLEMLVMVSADALASDPDRARLLSGLIQGREILEPERDTILDELEDFLARAGPDDTTVIFLAGHGLNMEDGYFVMPADARARGGELRRSSLVDWRDLQDQIDTAYGLRMLFVDTCHAANAVNPRFRKDTSDSRLVALTATLEEDVALEQSSLGHGVFTWALLEGLRGGADTEGTGVRLLGLTDFVDVQVRRLSNGKQTPLYHLPSTTNIVLTLP